MTALHEIRIRRGLDIAFAGRPRQALREAGAEVRSVAVCGHDFPGVRPELKVEPGQRVRAGDTLFVDRRRPEIAFTAPGAGTVAAINRGRRRSLDSLVIRLDGEEARSFALASAAPEAVRALLLESGLWPSFLTRPFGRIPDPSARADAIFVTATDTNPLAPDPRVAIGQREPEFRRGLELIAALTEGPVLVCHAPGPPLCEGTPARVRPVAVSGPHPAGLAGTHIHHLAPVGAGGRSVWQIGYQDVIAIGHLAETGQLLGERIVAVAGAGVRDPALVRLKAGASLDEALDGALAEGPVRIVSGSPLSGRESGWLGRYHDQVTVTPRDGGAPQGFWGRLRGLLGGAPDAAIVPREAFERVMPLDIVPVPLMRALAVGDVETAKALGCLELVEEDMALLSHLCATGTDYGALLRDTLDQLAEEGR